jgi:hypothetical protein
MTEMTTHSRELQLPQTADPAFQEGEWRLQRIGWGLLACLVLAAATGLLGGGPLGQETESTTDGAVTVHYDRFLHAYHASRLRIIVWPEAVADGHIRLSLNREFLDAVSVRQITPRPRAEQPGVDECVLVFDDASATGAGPFQMTIEVEPESAGPLEVCMRVNNLAPIRFRQFIYP